MGKFGKTSLPVKPFALNITRMSLLIQNHSPKILKVTMLTKQKTLDSTFDFSK